MKILQKQIQMIINSGASVSKNSLMAVSGKTLTIILGPTAAGKTEYAIRLATEIESPIISCDSRQIFREMNIGVARPSEAQLAMVKHYFIATKSITEHYTAGRYEIEALALLDELFKTHDRLIMCGGSGLYIDAVCNGLDDFPAADLELRTQLTERLDKEGLESLRYELKRLDPESYETIDIANPQRVVRALEVTLQTGRKFSDWKTGGAAAADRVSAMPHKQRPFKIEKIGVTRNRTELYERINTRVGGMMSAGLLDEVRGLRHFRPEYSSLRTVGYRELFDYLDGKTDLATATDLIKRNTRHYAKRQLTWWARDNNICWINLSGTKN
ncbi:MAG TPA: tRNA (adenosine(37)-N6)-dimethylallyltransferase MiaA [Candidatus Egerieousia sp.]|nr:tRNA (adenosine(37)-N6)-dimethylallyltransferase MiaA [Candidatus Egerieousia sp.]